MPLAVKGKDPALSRLTLSLFSRETRHGARLPNAGEARLMELAFTVKYESGEMPFASLDGYYGTQSLLGITQILLISVNAYINHDIVTRAPAARGFRLVLGTSRRGSWEQIINLIITDPNVISIVSDLGKNALYDLLKWGLWAGVGTPWLLRCNKSKKIVKELRKQNDDLQDKLDQALRRAHQPVKHQGLSVQIKANKTELVRFNKETLNFLETEVHDEREHAIEVCVSRFNTRTGTGRMISSIDAISIPFYPEGHLSENRKYFWPKISLRLRKEFSIQ
jgi:hypothetical protein